MPTLLGVIRDGIIYILDDEGRNGKTRIPRFSEFLELITAEGEGLCCKLAMDMFNQKGGCERTCKRSFTLVNFML